MSNDLGKETAAFINGALLPLTGGRLAYDHLLKQIGNAHFVLIGEASHGTHEFYRHRAEITKRLIQEKGFQMIAAEADWPDAHRVNRFVRGRSTDETAEESLGGFVRFPAWMWRNEVVAEFIDWLRKYNEGRSATNQAGFYGLDLYSLNRSRGRSCAIWNKWTRPRQNGLARITPASIILAKMNRHKDTRLVSACERYPHQSFPVGFTTNAGTVTAAHDWGDDPQLMEVRSALPGSYGALFHTADTPAFLLTFDSETKISTALRTERLERAIGVVYRPETERLSHYFHASLPDQFDAVLHVDRTTALHPLERHVEERPEEVPETFPSGV
jgi:erythromycin esterase-like protein